MMDYYNSDQLANSKKSFNPLIIVVGAVIVDANGQILCARRAADRSHGGYWEFPGGKIEAGESEPAALQREIFEELGIRIAVGERITETTHAYEKVTVRLITYFARIQSGEIQLNDHDQMLWADVNELSKLKWAPADIPTVEILKNKKSSV